METRFMQNPPDEVEFPAKNVMYCGNPECDIVQQAKRPCQEPNCPQAQHGEHGHCRKCEAAIFF